MGLLRDLLPSGFPTKILYIFLNAPIRATFPTHLLLLDFITLMMSEEYTAIG